MSTWMKRGAVLCVAAAICAGCTGCGMMPLPEESLTQSNIISTESFPSSQPSVPTVEWSEQPATANAVPLAGIPSPTAVKGRADAGAQTFTGLTPLPARTIAIADPNNSRGLPLKKIAHSYGVAKDGKPHFISLENQRFFESKQYAAVAYDTTGKKVIYLTFDCGYENGNTALILDVLKAKKVPAAFFCTMDELKTAPEIVARMINEGHIVGNHSTKHPSFAEVDRSRMAQEILECDNYLRERFGYTSPFFRFPKGEYTESALEAVASLGFVSVFWSAAYSDWDVSVVRGGQYAADTVLSRLHPGAILLLHSVSKDNADGMAQIIDRARAAGYQFQELPALPIFNS